MTEPAVDRHVFVVLGGTGDLMERKLLPALYGISTSAGSPDPVQVLGCSRREIGAAAYQQYAADALVKGGVASRSKALRWSRSTVSHTALADNRREDYRQLRLRIEELERAHSLPGNRVLYLALPSTAFAPTIRALGVAGLNESSGWTRFVIEKPFGHDLASARQLNRLIHRYFPERAVYRIDHYLGKETVQNLLVFRFANMLFESVWNRDRVEHIEITVAEDLGVEHRAAYYDGVGALRDMVQSHLIQLLALTAMEVPTNLDADQVRNEKVKVIRSLQPIRPEDVVYGQYGPGAVGGTPLLGYRQEPGVQPRSRTETFVSLRLQVNSWRWHGIPFYLRTGKRLPTKLTRIVVRFREPPVWFFPRTSANAITANTLTITLQPDEGFDLGIEIKRPGRSIELETHHLHFRYSEAFGRLPEAYQTLLLDVLRGDQTLFVRADEVEESWRVLAPILRRPPRPRPYEAGSWGPRAAEELLSRDGHEWTAT